VHRSHRHIVCWFGFRCTWNHDISLLKHNKFLLVQLRSMGQTGNLKSLLQSSVADQLDAVSVCCIVQFHWFKIWISSKQCFQIESQCLMLCIRWSICALFWSWLGSYPLCLLVFTKDQQCFCSPLFVLCLCHFFSKTNSGRKIHCLILSRHAMFDRELFEACFKQVFGEEADNCFQVIEGQHCILHHVVVELV